MGLHTLHDLALMVNEDTAARRGGLTRLLQDLSFVTTRTAPPEAPALVVSVRLSARSFRVPGPGRDLFRSDGLRGVEVGDDAYVSDGSSLLHLQARRGKGDAQLAPAFFDRSRLLRQRFWAFGLMMLLRHRGLYGLHAAGVSTPAGLHLLLIGPSGCGKSTLAIGLLRHGWRYLSDDTVLLRGAPHGVEALAFRKPFSIDAAAAGDYADLRLGRVGPSSSGRPKRRADVQAAYPEQYLPMCLPHVLLFPRIVSAAQSVLRPLDRSTSLGYLLAQSGPELFDRATMAGHLAVLTRLVRQAATYELLAGRDLQQCPTTLQNLLAEVGGARCG